MDLGIGAQGAIHLLHNGETAGLNLYARTAGAFDRTTVQIAELFATHAGALLGYADQVEQLSEALHTRTDIGTAIGILMERYGIDRHQAFALLSRNSQHRNIKVRLLAQQIIAGTFESTPKRRQRSAGLALASARLTARHFGVKPAHRHDAAGPAEPTRSAAVCGERCNVVERESREVGPVEISATREGDRAVATPRSPDVDCFPLAEELLAELLAALGGSVHDLDSDLQPALGFGGNRHPVLVADLDRLATSSYDFDALQCVCRTHDWVTVQLVAPARRVPEDLGFWRLDRSR